MLQYVLCAINGKNSGIRMVQNVLSAHGSKKITGAKAA